VLFSITKKAQEYLRFGALAGGSTQIPEIKSWIPAFAGMTIHSGNSLIVFEAWPRGGFLQGVW
jgi:hypothetical protein